MLDTAHTVSAQAGRRTLKQSRAGQSRPPRARLQVVMSLDEVAAALGTTREGVHYTEKVALDKLRKALAKRGYRADHFISDDGASSDQDDFLTRVGAIE